MTIGILYIKIKIDQLRFGFISVVVVVVGCMIVDFEGPPFLKYRQKLFTQQQ